MVLKSLLSMPGIARFSFSVGHSGCRVQGLAFGFDARFDFVEDLVDLADRRLGFPFQGGPIQDVPLGEDSNQISAVADQHRNAVLLIEESVHAGFGSDRLRPAELGGDQGTRAVTESLLEVVGEQATG